MVNIEFFRGGSSMAVTKIGVSSLTVIIFATHFLRFAATSRQQLFS